MTPLPPLDSEISYQYLIINGLDMVYRASEITYLDPIISGPDIVFRIDKAESWAHQPLPLKPF